MEITGLRTLSALVQALTPGTASIIGLGFVLGLKHALDADHLIAVSTIVSERKGLLGSTIVGAFWGLGHTTSLLFVGVLVTTFNVQIPGKIALTLEFCVAVMLVGLGSRVLWKLSKGGTLHLHVHEHHGTRHAHAHIHAYEELLNEDHQSQSHSHGPWLMSKLSRTIKAILPSRSTQSRSVLIGIVHGMAGSAAIMLLALPAITSPILRLAYIGVFGVGSIGGMVIMSSLISIPFVVSSNKSGILNLAVRGLSGMLSIGFGLFLAWQIGFVDGLFLMPW